MIIGLCGKKGSGKDTAAQYLVDNYGYQRIGFADSLKESLANLFDIPIELIDDWKEPSEQAQVRLASRAGIHINLSWREFLQRYGTEAHRDVFGESFWVEQVLPYYSDEGKYVHLAKQKLVISDVRFPNEAARINTYGGFLVEIVRPSLDNIADPHRSEQKLKEDFELLNQEDNMRNLYTALDEFMETQVGNR